MRRFLIAYPVWQKPDMVPWLMSGIADHIDPARADVLFMFTNCGGESAAAFERCKNCLAAFKTETFSWQDEKFWELTHHNRIMEWFIANGSWNMLVVPQDDNYIEGRTLLDDLNKLMDKYGDGLGVVGGRDGYDCGYRNMVGSPHSLSAHKMRSLAIGEFAERLLSNTGPRVYPRKMIEKIGLHDETMCHYTMDDYCLRAQVTYGFINGVMGMDVIHKKFGRCLPTNVHPSVQVNDLKIINDRWKPILGHGVI